MINQWEISLSSKHTVQVEHDGSSGAVLILVDKKEILRTNLPRDEDLDYRFSIEAKPCALRILPVIKKYGDVVVSGIWHYELWLENGKQEPVQQEFANEKKGKWWEFWK